jgi:hypothetical protein
LNRITLFALIFSIGILVDDAIVVVENIVRHFHLPQNQDRSRAVVAIEAVGEVGNPTILATFAVIAAVLPMAFVGGLMGPYMRPIPIGASAAMAFSLAISFIVTPWAAVRILQWRRNSRGNEAQIEIGNRQSAIGNQSEPPHVGYYKIAPALQACSKSVPAKAATAWKQFVETISQLEDKTVRKSAAKMLRIVMDAGYDDYLKENFANYRNRLEDLEQLAVFAYQFGSVEDFLTQLALLTNVEAEDGDATNRDDEQIRLSTIHQAKGLEFDVVFVIMLCDGLFPSARSMETPEGEEEERRLFYVAITRAKNELYLSYPLERASFSKSGGDTMQQPSRFLSEIPRDLLNEWNLRSRYA